MLPNPQPNDMPLPTTPLAATQAEQMKARMSELDASHEAELKELEEEAARAVHLKQQPSLTPGQKRFYNSEQCAAARLELQALVDNPQYDTESEYYSSNERAFVDRHLHFLSMHPGTHLAGYISNLKLMTNTKSRR